MLGPFFLPVGVLHSLNELLLILEIPVDPVLLSSAKVNHDVLVAEEEHDIHVVEVRHLGDINHVNNCNFTYGHCS